MFALAGGCEMMPLCGGVDMWFCVFVALCGVAVVGIGLLWWLLGNVIRVLVVRVLVFFMGLAAAAHVLMRVIWGVCIKGRCIRQAIDAVKEGDDA